MLRVLKQISVIKIMEYLEWKERYYIPNRSYFQNYYKDYGRIYREANKKNCLYKLINKSGLVVYIGSTTDFKARLANHYACNSNLDLTYERWCELNCDHWEKTYISEDINRTELYYMEQLVIDNCKDITLLNEEDAYNEKTRIREKLEIVSSERKIELQELIKDLTFSRWNR